MGLFSEKKSKIKELLRTRKGLIEMSVEDLKDAFFEPNPETLPETLGNIITHTKRLLNTKPYKHSIRRLYLNTLSNALLNRNKMSSLDHYLQYKKNLTLLQYIKPELAKNLNNSSSWFFNLLSKLPVLKRFPKWINKKLGIDPEDNPNMPPSFDKLLKQYEEGRDEYLQKATRDVKRQIKALEKKTEKLQSRKSKRTGIEENLRQLEANLTELEKVLPLAELSESRTALDNCKAKNALNKQIEELSEQTGMLEITKREINSRLYTEKVTRLGEKAKELGYDLAELEKTLKSELQDSRSALRRCHDRIETEKAESTKNALREKVNQLKTGLMGLKKKLETDESEVKDTNSIEKEAMQLEKKAKLLAKNVVEQLEEEHPYNFEESKRQIKDYIKKAQFIQKFAQKNRLFSELKSSETGNPSATRKSLEAFTNEVYHRISDSGKQDPYEEIYMSSMNELIQTAITSSDPHKIENIKKYLLEIEEFYDKFPEKSKGVMHKKLLLQLTSLAKKAVENHNTSHAVYYYSVAISLRQFSEKTLSEKANNLSANIDFLEDNLREKKNALAQLKTSEEDSNYEYPDDTYSEFGDSDDEAFEDEDSEHSESGQTQTAKLKSSIRSQQAELKQKNREKRLNEEGMKELAEARADLLPNAKEGQDLLAAILPDLTSYRDALRTVKNLTPGEMKLLILKNTTYLQNSISSLQQSLNDIKRSIQIKEILNGNVQKEVDVIKKNIQSIKDALSALEGHHEEAASRKIRECHAPLSACEKDVETLARICDFTKSANATERNLVSSMNFAKKALKLMPDSPGRMELAKVIIDRMKQEIRLKASKDKHTTVCTLCDKVISFLVITGLNKQGEEKENAQKLITSFQKINSFASDLIASNGNAEIRILRFKIFFAKEDLARISSDSSERKESIEQIIKQMKQEIRLETRKGEHENVRGLCSRAIRFVRDEYPPKKKEDENVEKLITQFQTMQRIATLCKNLASYQKEQSQDSETRGFLETIVKNAGISPDVLLKTAEEALRIMDSSSSEREQLVELVTLRLKEEENAEKLIKQFDKIQRVVTLCKDLAFYRKEQPAESKICSILDAIVKNTSKGNPETLRKNAEAACKLMNPSSLEGEQRLELETLREQLRELVTLRMEEEMEIRKDDYTKRVDLSKETRNFIEAMDLKIPESPKKKLPANKPITPRKERSNRGPGFHTPPRRQLPEAPAKGNEGNLTIQV